MPTPNANICFSKIIGDVSPVWLSDYTLQDLRGCLLKTAVVGGSSENENRLVLPHPIKNYVTITIMLLALHWTIFGAWHGEMSGVNDWLEVNVLTWKRRWAGWPAGCWLPEGNRPWWQGWARLLEYKEEASSRLHHTCSLHMELW